MQLNTTQQLGLSPEQKQSIWMPPQPQAPQSISMTGLGTPAARLGAMLDSVQHHNNQTHRHHHNTPNSAQSHGSNDSTPERVGVLENEVKQLRRALFLQQQQQQTKNTKSGASGRNGSAAKGTSLSPQKNARKRPGSPREFKGHPIVKNRSFMSSFTLIHFVLLLGVSMGVIAWAGGYLDGYILGRGTTQQNSRHGGRGDHGGSDGNDGIKSDGIKSDGINSDDSSGKIYEGKEQTNIKKKVMSGAAADFDGRLDEDDVVWALTEDRGWRLGHIQKSNRTHTISVEHVSVHLLTTDPSLRSSKDLIHVRKYDQVRRVHPNLLHDRRHIVSYTKVVDLLMANNNGIRDISEDLASDACLSLGDLARSTTHRVDLLQVDNIITTIVNTLESFSTDRNVQHSCILALGNLAHADSNTIRQFKNARTKEMIAKAMETLPQSSEVVSASCVAMGNIAAAEHVFPGYANTRIQVSVKAVQLALLGMKEHVSSSTVQVRCAFAIGAVCRSSASLQRTATDIMGVDTMLSAMSTHSNNPLVQFRLAFAITNTLSLNPIGRKTFGESSVKLLLNAMKTFQNDRRLQLWSCRALYQLIMGNQKNRDAALAAQGISIVLETQKLHEEAKDVKEASERVINLLWEF